MVFNNNLNYPFGADRIIRFLSRMFVVWRWILKGDTLTGAAYGFIVVDSEGLGDDDGSKHSVEENKKMI